jgi:hypothetical protein
MTAKVIRSPWRPRKIASPEFLLVRFVAYADFVETHPFFEDMIFKSQNGFVHTKLRKARPMSIAGFCQFLKVTPQSWRNWRKSRQDLLEVVEVIDGAISAHQFEGAAAGLFKANIISRELSFGRRF